MKRFILISFAALAALSSTAKVQLTPVFSDNMVFQQRCMAPVWGKAEPGSEVSVTPSWNNKTYITSAGTDGRWEVSIPTPKGGFRKYTLMISDGEPLVLKNVVVGEVWLASGQSNIEMWFERMAGRTGKDEYSVADGYPDIRMLHVSRATGMVERDSFTAEGEGWRESSAETVRRFSVAGWYFARKLQEELKVPVGIINSSWGGTFIEAWMSSEAIGCFPETRSQLDLVKLLPDDESRREEVFEEVIDSIYRKVWDQDPGLKGGWAAWASPGFDDSQWKDISLPRTIQELWPGTNGICWLRKEIEIPAEWEGHDLALSLGPVDDFDDTWWNGELVGSCRVWNKPRVYSIPARMVKTGKTVICIRNTDDHGNGGLYGKASLLFVEGPDGHKIRLDGDWKACLSMSFKGMPMLARHEPNLATVLYNAMIKPLAPFAIKGAIWYQGESNASDAYRYRDLMSAMVLDWRELWGYDFPFYITQIANYQPVTREAGDDDWAELRESQAKSAAVLDKAGMACIIDIGEADDIHPVRKQEVGERLARLALANDYGKKVIANGPRFAGYTLCDNAMRVRFTDVAGGLKVIPSGDYATVRYGNAGMDSELVKKAESGVLCGFQIAGADRIWHWADAVIEGSEVVVSSPEVAHPVAVRYGWGANPVCNLFNSEGLPAWPFRTDDWQCVTY